MAQRTLFAAAAVLTLGLTISVAALARQEGSTAQTAQAAQTGQTAAPAADAPQNPSVAAFERRVKEYVKLREGLEAEKLPKLPKDARPEQIEAHKTGFQKLVRAARAGARPGQIFTRDIAAHIRALIKSEYRGRERVELRKSIAEADVRGVPMRVNYPYPASQELVEMPVPLLLKLPTLPKQVKYRFVGRRLLLVDRENALIIDYMTNALP